MAHAKHKLHCYQTPNILDGQDHHTKIVTKNIINLYVGKIINIIRMRPKLALMKKIINFIGKKPKLALNSWDPRVGVKPIMNGFKIILIMNASMHYPFKLINGILEISPMRIV